MIFYWCQIIDLIIINSFVYWVLVSVMCVFESDSSLLWEDKDESLWHFTVWTIVCIIFICTFEKQSGL